MVYYGQSRKLREYLNDRYGNAESASSISAFRGKPGILFVKYDSSNHGMMGLWDGNKVYQMDDFTNKGSQMYLWGTRKGIYREIEWIDKSKGVLLIYMRKCVTEYNIF